MKKFLLIFVMALCSLNITAQNARLYGSKEYGSGELSSNLINKLCQDAQGFIWIATDYGLNKFDGLKFTQYAHSKKNPLSPLSNNVNTLMLDKKNILWIGYNNGLQYYSSKEDTFHTISFPNNIAPHIAYIFQFRNGDIWASTSGEGIFAIDIKNSRATFLKEITQLTGNFVTYIYQDKQNNIWISKDNRGISRISPSLKKIKDFQSPALPHNTITGIVEDKNGRLLLSMSTAVCVYNDENETFRTLGYAPGIRGMVMSKKGTAFIATEGQGVMCIAPNSEKLSALPRSGNSLNYTSAKITSLIEDRDQNIWLGCFQKGLLMIPNGETQFDYWGVVNKDYQLGSNITSICKSIDGYLWVSVNKEGVLQLDNKGNVKNKIEAVQDITKLFEDSQHNLWATSYSRGLGRIDKSRGTYSFMNIPFSGYMKTMTESTDNELFISTFGTGFIRYNPKTGKYQQYDMRQTDTKRGSLKNDWINTMLCDSEGQIWMGHYRGISRFNPATNTFDSRLDNNELSDQICISLLQDKDGKLWVGTYNGLFTIDPKTFKIKSYTTEDGLSNNVICGMAEDQQGNIWCSTFKGINQLLRKENKIISYYIGNGLIDKIYNRGVYCKDENGKIWFGGNTGITSLFPENIQTTAYNFRVKPTNVYLRGQVINTATLSGRKNIVKTSFDEAKEFHFAYEDNTFTFEFSTMDFKDPESIFYEYRLKELSKNWSSTQPGINQITYNHLNPGNYTLEVRACKYGAFTPISEFTITIAKPWYRTTFAIVLYLLFIIGLSVLIYKFLAKRRQEQVKESKLQFFTDISHEIRSPLTLIISPLEKLLKEDFDAITMRTLRGIHRNSSRILGLVNQLLDIRKFDMGQMKLKYSETNLVAFIEEVFEVFEYQSSERDIRFTFEHEMDELWLWIDRNNFDKILINLLSNAFKYTPNNGEITVQLSVDEKFHGTKPYAKISVLDSGSGLDENNLKKIFDRFYQEENQTTHTTLGSGIGLNLAKILIELHHGKIVASNRKDRQGSCFTIWVPLGKEHLKNAEIVGKVSEDRPVLKQGELINDIENREKIVKRATGYKLLIVDDEIEIRDYLSQELESQYKIFTAGDGEEGLQKALEKLPDLIISDVKMPLMDGFDFAKRVKSNNNISHIPLILLTSKTEYQDRITGLDRGADAFLTKPFNTTELQITIQNLLKSRSVMKGKFSGAQDQDDKVKPVAFKSSDEILMKRIMNIINENIGNPDLNVEMLASEVSLSRVQLHRKVKELTSLSTGEFIRNIRLKQAATLLKEKKMNISQIAYSIGFSNQTHFSTAFKKHYGISPKEYISKNG